MRGWVIDFQNMDNTGIIFVFNDKEYDVDLIRMELERLGLTVLGDSRTVVDVEAEISDLAQRGIHPDLALIDNMAPHHSGGGLGLWGRDVE